MVQQLVYSTPVNVMNEQSKDKCDRELFSELSEPPIHPLLIHIVPPLIEENNPGFTLQMNGEAAWRLREIYWLPQKVFELLQTSIMPLGYRLIESSCDRVGRTIGENIRRFKRRMETITNGKKGNNSDQRRGLILRSIPKRSSSRQKIH